MQDPGIRNGWEESITNLLMWGEKESRRRRAEKKVEKSQLSLLGRNKRMGTYRETITQGEATEEIRGKEERRVKETEFFRKTAR